MNICSTWEFTKKRGLSYLEVKKFHATEKLLADWGILDMVCYKLGDKQEWRWKNLEESLSDGLFVITSDTSPWNTAIV